MLLQGECTAVGSSQAAKNFNFSKSRYYQIRNAFTQQGVAALISKKTGPKRNYRRTPEITKLVIRCRFLDPKASSEVIASKLRQDGHIIATRSVERIISDYGLQKKLHLQFPAPATHLIDTQRTKETRRLEPADPLSLERTVRKLLCNKISGNLVGIWLLIPEHLRLGTWDLLKRWTGKSTAQVEPRIAAQAIETPNGSSQESPTSPRHQTDPDILCFRCRISATNLLHSGIFLPQHIKSYRGTAQNGCRNP